MTVEAQDQRINILNGLLKTPHRSLAESYPTHNKIINDDPLFYSRLAAWYAQNGEIRDHKELFIINLCLSKFDGHRDVGLALLRELPPYQLVRVLDFIHGKTVKKVTETKVGKKTNRTSQDVKVGLFKNIPNSIVTEVTRYLRERENDEKWFDSSVLTARKYLKRLYGLLHVKPSERADNILFKGVMPENSSLSALQKLRQAKTAEEQARAIIDNKIPYRVASTVIDSMTPTVMLALIEVMTDQELINNVGSLKKRGAFDNADLKALINGRLEKAKKSKKVSALKSTEAVKASNVDEDTKKILMDVADSQLKSKGRITRSTALIIDKSGSMSEAIDIGKQMAAMISAVMDAPFYVYAVDTMAYQIKAKGNDLQSWTDAFKGITSNGGTGLGAGLSFLRKDKIPVEQIMMITDEGENTSPAFMKALTDYAQELKIDVPYVFFLQSGDRRHFGEIVGKLQRANIACDAFAFAGDYYSLPGLIPYLRQNSRLDLLMEIMSVELPVRKAS